MSYRQIIEKYWVHIHVTQSETYFRRSIAENVIADFLEMKLAVIGMDAVEIQDDEISPKTDFICDWSAVCKEVAFDSAIQKCAELSLHALKKLPDDSRLYLTFVVIDAEDAAAV